MAATRARLVATVVLPVPPLPLAIPIRTSTPSLGYEDAWSALYFSRASLTVPPQPVTTETPAAARVSDAFGPQRPVRTTETPRSATRRAAWIPAP